MLTGKELKLFNALSPYASENNIEIVTVEVVGSKKAPTIRVFIDCEGGVGFDELSSAQSWINDVMDELDPFPGAYTLEVSSPGIDRPLRSLEHFQRFAGEKVFLQLSSVIDGRARWTGLLKGVEDDCVLIEIDGDVKSLPYKQIKKAHVIGAVDFSA